MCVRIVERIRVTNTMFSIVNISFIEPVIYLCLVILSMILRVFYVKSIIRFKRETVKQSLRLSATKTTTV